MAERPLRIAIVVGEESGDQLGAGLIDAIRRRRPDAALIRPRRRADAGARHAELLPDRRRRRDGPRLDPPASAAHRAARLRDGRRNPCTPSLTCSSSSTARTSRTRWRSGSRGAGRTCRSSTTCRRRSGPGASGRARKMTRYVDHVLALLPFEPEALSCGSAARLAPMSAIRWSSGSTSCAPSRANVRRSPSIRCSSCCPAAAAPRFRGSWRRSARLSDSSPRRGRGSRSCCRRCRISSTRSRRARRSGRCGRRSCVERPRSSRRSGAPMRRSPPPAP